VAEAYVNFNKIEGEEKEKF